MAFKASGWLFDLDTPLIPGRISGIGAVHGLSIYLTPFIILSSSTALRQAFQEDLELEDPVVHDIWEWKI